MAQCQAQNGRRQYICRDPATLTIVIGCVHEHVDTFPTCQRHADLHDRTQQQYADRVFCRPCHDLPGSAGHRCRQQHTYQPLDA